tara:strand:- start:368 stop:640 length:273 start_codon:yes stop_codon:yes gene_type:complete
VVSNPYLDKANSEYFVRTFKSDVHEDELVWHQDHENRCIKIVEGTNWQLQFDNRLPVTLETGEEYYIPKNTFHRIHKGTGNLVVNIREIK